jgi:imidazole glycerol-phosphate synthase subunit HisH
MSGPRIAVVDYGIGNLRSAEKALQHVDADARLTSDVREIEAAHAVVLPGVGAFGACMQALRAFGLEAAAKSAATDGRPFLGICIGMQMLFDGSDETPDIAGLGVVAGRVTLLPRTVRLPQMGWNTLDVTNGSRLAAHLPDPAWLYFVHSYAPEPEDDRVVAAWCDYGRRFAAAVETGPLWATQFHPEKSGDVGMRMLRNFVEAVASSRVG